VKKLAAELDVPMIDLVEQFIREGLRRIGSRASASPRDRQESLEGRDDDEERTAVTPAS